MNNLLLKELKYTAYNYNSLNVILKKVKKLCNKYNLLFIADEIQTGLGRTGKLFACDYDNVKPDILILGKSLSGGFYLIYGVLTSNNIMSLLKPGQHGSTYGGNPLASSICVEALKIIKDEDLVNNSYNMGNYFRKVLKNENLKDIKEIRGKGLFNAIEFDNKENANKILENFIKNGILTQIIHNKIIRMCPQLTIKKEEMDDALNKIIKSIK